MGIYLLDRWLILRGSVHLLYDINDAEYGFFRVARRFESTPLWQILTDTGTRMQFLHECKTVGNQVHGTLGIAGLELLVAMKAFGAGYSTLTLKALALFGSTLALVLWMVGLGRGLRTPWVPVAFALLFTLASPIFTKLSMLFWGTHELVIVLHGLMICLLGGWISRPAGPAKSFLRLFLAGILAAILALCNYSLLMAGLFTLGWLSAAGGLHAWRRNRNPAGLLLIPALFGVALLGFFGTQSIVLGSMVLEGLGYPGQVNWQHPFGLSGKQGQSFLFEFGGNWRDPLAWQNEVRPNALSMVPSAPPNAAGAGSEIWVRYTFFIAALLCSLRGIYGWIRGWMGPRRSTYEAIDGQPLSVYLSVYLVVGFLTITWLSLTTGLTQDDIEGIQPRYYAHLYPVAFAVLACWCCARPRWIRMLPLGAVLWLGLQDHQQMMGDNPEALERYDGVRAWMQYKNDVEPSAERIGYGAASRDFVAGTRILEEYPDRRSLLQSFRWPAELRQPVHIQPLRDHMQSNQIRNPSEDWWRGVGYAYSILIPVERRHQFNEIKSHFSQGAQAMEQGYSMTRQDLEK